MTWHFCCRSCTDLLFIYTWPISGWIFDSASIFSFHRFRKSLTEYFSKFNRQTNITALFLRLPVFVFRPSLCQMTWWERCLGTEPPSAPSSPWSPGGGSSTSRSRWRSLFLLDRQKAIPAATEATLHPACVCSAASQASRPVNNCSMPTL